MKLYLTKFEYDGDDYGRFIQAESVEAAFKIWRNFQLAEGMIERNEFNENLDTSNPVYNDDLAFFEIEQSDEPGILGWHNAEIGGVAKLVGSTNA